MSRVVVGGGWTAYVRGRSMNQSTPDSTNQLRSPQKEVISRAKTDLMPSARRSAASLDRRKPSR